MHPCRGVRISNVFPQAEWIREEIAAQLYRALTEYATLTGGCCGKMFGIDIVLYSQNHLHRVQWPSPIGVWSRQPAWDDRALFKHNCQLVYYYLTNSMKMFNSIPVPKPGPDPDMAVLAKEYVLFKHFPSRQIRKLLNMWPHLI